MKKFKKTIYTVIAIAGCGLMLSSGAQAAEIVVTWESNGVLVAEGLEPGTTGTVEAVSCLGDAFTNAAAFFSDGYIVDSNGTIRLEIPMYFRVSGTLALPLEGMVEIPAGINSGTNPLGAGESYQVYYPETYSLTNETAFYMDATEVTKAKWDVVYNWATNHSYSFSSPGYGQGMDHPVFMVNWYDSAKWCNARSEMSGKTPCYTVDGSIYKTGESTPDCDLDAVGHRLPTSGEWEYAARGGLSGKRFPWGDTITHSEANYYSSSTYDYDTSPTRQYHPDYGNEHSPFTSPAGSFAANGYGLYDMTGNMFEWSADWHPSFEGTSRGIRSGSAHADARNARCGYEYWSYPGESSVFVGFRSVLPTE